MKAQSNGDKFLWEPLKPQSNDYPLSSHTQGNNTCSSSSNKSLPKLMMWLILFLSATCVVYTLNLLSASHASCDDDDGEMFKFNNLRLTRPTNHTVVSPRPPAVGVVTDQALEPTGVEHIVFGVAASSKLWNQRKEYIKLWWKPRMRGTVWLDSPVRTYKNESLYLPDVRISSDTSRFRYKNKQGHRSAIRISRIVSETLRLGGLGDDGVRWLVMGDDDTVFVTDNLVRILRKYDHRQYYYIGGLSESHLQNIYFSYGMAYGGGGFAVSYPLAKALEKMQDRCIQKYPGLYGSDDRMQACMAELGVPLTKELGFHQYDVYGNLFGLLAAHPVAPLVSLHHLDVVEPIFPNATRVQALKRLEIPMQLDSAGLMQQSICYYEKKGWTLSVSWGFAVQIFRGVVPPREVEMPSRTFLNWYRRADYTAYAFNTRPVMRNPCQKPFVFYLSKAGMESRGNLTHTTYERHRLSHPECRWKMADPDEIERVEVYKKLDPYLWDRSPRRNCCRVLRLEGKKRLVLEVGLCREGEVAQV